MDGRRLLPGRLLLGPPVVLELEGGLDGCQTCAAMLEHYVRAVLAGRCGALVVLDLAGVASIDAAGVDAVRLLAVGLAGAGHGLWLWVPSPAVERALELAGLDEDLQPLSGGQASGFPGVTSTVVAGLGNTERLAQLERLKVSARRVMRRVFEGSIGSEQQ